MIPRIDVRVARQARLERPACGSPGPGSATDESSEPAPADAAADSCRPQRENAFLPAIRTVRASLQESARERSGRGPFSRRANLRTRSRRRRGGRVRSRMLAGCASARPACHRSPPRSGSYSCAWNCPIGQGRRSIAKAEDARLAGRQGDLPADDGGPRNGELHMRRARIQKRAVIMAPAAASPVASPSQIPTPPQPQTKPSA